MAYLGKFFFFDRQMRDCDLEGVERTKNKKGGISSGTKDLILNPLGTQILALISSWLSGLCERAHSIRKYSLWCKCGLMEAG